MNAGQMALIPTHILLSDGVHACSYPMSVVSARWSAVPANHRAYARDGLWNETSIKIEIGRTGDRYILVCLKGVSIDTQYAHGECETRSEGQAGDVFHLRPHSLVISRDAAFVPVLAAQAFAEAGR